MVATPEYSVHVQAKFVLAMVALYNFIHIYDSDDMEDNKRDEVERQLLLIQLEDLGGNIS